MKYYEFIKYEILRITARAEGYCEYYVVVL